MLEAYLISLAGILLGQASPGPNLLAVVGAALGQGRRQAIFVALGVATGVLTWATIAAFGLATLLAIYPSLISVMKLLGGSYLCFLALKALQAAWRDSERAFRAHKADWTALEAWRRGLMINLTNPKSALLWSAVATFLFGSGLSAVQVLGFGPIGFISAFVIYSIYAVLFSSGFAKRNYARFSRGIEAVFGLVFGAIGGKLASDGLGELNS